MGLFNDTANLVFFEDLGNKGNYMMFISSPEIAWKRYEQYTRTGRYDETGRTEPYGYIELNISKPAFYPLPLQNERQAELFLLFIKDNKVTQHTEIALASSWGWFKFSENIEIGKWLKEYDTYEAQKQQEYLKMNNAGLQTALF